MSQNKKEKLPFISMLISSAVIFVATALIGIYLNSNLWPFAATIYAGLGSLIVYFTVWLFCKIKYKNL